MKKYVCLILALVLTAAMAVPALASFESGEGTDSVDITAEYHAPSSVDAGPVYSVTLEWTTSGRIAYDGGTVTYSWNDGTLRYDTREKTPGQWVVDNAKIDFTVRNRSNRPVDVSFADPANTEGNVIVSGTYSQRLLQLGSAATGGFESQGAEQIATSTFTVTGVTGEIQSSGIIATIAVTIQGK